MHKNDLLRRIYAGPAAFDNSPLRGSKILVTGAGGSIGSVLCETVAKARPELLVMLDAYDGNLYHLEQKIGGGPTHRFTVGDVRDLNCLMAVVRRYRFDFVFHAAALKHVPMLEDPLNMLEAARTNVIGTWNVMQAAADLTDPVVVNVSTDKAVHPSSILGLTKRCAEIYTRCASGRWGSKFSSVRFGNVLDSVGSVIPLFRRQIADGGPITITDMRMTRYFMTAESAAALVVKAAITMQGERGYRVFTPLLGDQIKIVDLVNALIEEYAPAGSNISVVETGIRPGEKYREHMRYESELVGVSHWPDVNELVDCSPPPSEQHLDELSEHVERRSANLIARLMKRVVPEYTGEFVA